jgi:hypothetical protein
MIACLSFQLSGTTLRLTVSSQGLGPLFKIKLSLKNTGQKPISDVPVTVMFNPALYEIPLSAIRVRVCDYCNSFSKARLSLLLLPD